MSYKFGFWQTTSLVVGNIVGSGILMLPASLAVYGTFSLIGWALTSVGAIFLGLVFARLSHRFSKSGGPYVYVKEVFGRFLGFQIAWSYWLANVISNLAVVIAFVSYLSVAYPSLRENSLYGFSAGLLVLWICVILNLLSLKLFGRIQILVTLLKIIPLIILSCIGIFYVDWSYLYPLTLAEGKTPWQTILATMSLSVFSFIGIESATIPSEKIERPKQVIAWATVSGTLIAALIYIWISVVIMGILGTAQLSSSPAPFADAFGHMFGSKTSYIVSLVGAFSCLSTLNGWMLLQSQMPMAVAQDGLFPKFFSVQSASGVPWKALLVSALLMSVILLCNYTTPLSHQFSTIVNLTSFSVLFSYLFSGIADLVLLYKDRASSFIILGSLLATVYASTALLGVGCDSFLVGAGLMLIGTFLYYLMRKKR